MSCRSTLDSRREEFQIRPIGKTDQGVVRIAASMNAAGDDGKPGRSGVRDRAIQIVREGGQIQRKQYLAAHGIHIAQRIGSRNRTERVRIIHDGWKEIDRADNGLLVVQLIDGGIVRPVKPYQHLREVARSEDRLKWAQHLRQIGWPDFARSTRARGE